MCQNTILLNTIKKSFNSFVGQAGPVKVIIRVGNLNGILSKTNHGISIFFFNFLDQIGIDFAKIRNVF